MRLSIFNRDTKSKELCAKATVTISGVKLSRCAVADDEAREAVVFSNEPALVALAAVCKIRATAPGWKPAANAAADKTYLRLTEADVVIKTAGYQTRPKSSFDASSLDVEAETGDKP